MNQAKNIGLRKKWLAQLTMISVGLICFVASIFAATDYTVETIPNVRLTDRYNHVSNPDGILQAEHVARMNQVLRLVEDSLGIEVAVVAVSSIGDNDARMFATDLFKHWGLGQKKKDNGLLIQLVTEPTQRSVVFETGYGIEGVLPDAICYRLQQKYMIADLKAGNYSEGMLNGVFAVSKYLLASDYERGAMTGKVANDDDPVWPIVVSMVFFIGVAIFISYQRYRPKKCPCCGRKTFSYMGEHVVREATHFSEGEAETVYRCRSCGFTDKRKHKIDRLHNRGGGGPIIMGGGGGGFSDFGGGSWGGGSSGGGGSISRF